MAADKKGKAGGRALWIWVILAFVILISAWTTLILIAVQNQPERIEIQEP
ncbi:MAG: hypothetical protein R6V45_00335 [Oceanipulchritudo sp.]